MRIVIDLQGAQSGSRHRGIGRYSLALAKAMIENRREHEIIIALNGLFPETIEPIRATFDGILPQENIVVWHACGPVHSLDPANTWRRHTAELMRETFLASLKPDIVHITSLFEGFDDNAVHSIGATSNELSTAVTFYDVIPLIQNDVYLTPNPTFEKLYREKLAYLKRADLYLAISESSRQESIDHLDAKKEKAINIGSAVDAQFKPVSISLREEEAIRKKFGLSRRFLMYSGATDERKNHLRLIKAFSLLPADIRKSHQLAIVGGLPGTHQAKFEAYIKFCGLTNSDVVITGRVSDDDMVHLYNLCELFVFPSWHEGFGLPALEAMSCGAPVIGANTTSLPEVIGREDALFDPFSEKSIAKKIIELVTNDSLRADFSRHSLEQAKKFSWDESAKKSIDAFEIFYAKKKDNHFIATKQISVNELTSNLIEKIATLDNLPEDDSDWQKTAKSITQNHDQSAEKQLLVDISELVQRDAKTGVQRVVRSILLQLLKNPPSGFRVEPVYATTQETGYRYARKFTNIFSNSPGPALNDDPIDIGRKDIFLGLDLSFIVLHQTDFYAHLRNIGVRVHFVVYDLLPILTPQLFPNHIPAVYSQWLRALTQSDSVVCISRSVADEMIEWLAASDSKRLRPFNLNWFHLGADVAGSAPTKGLPTNAQNVLNTLSLRPTFLMVGTIEPRKGQMQTLAAFERLWDQGVDVNLVIVGKHGWNVDLLVEILRSHSERNNRLFWLDGISDEYLEKIYAASTCLIAASEGEGFGLPLIEAAQKKLPIIARDISVFREVAGEYAFYFSGFMPDALAKSVCEWMALDKNKKTPQSENIAWLTWEQSTKNLLEAILGNNSYKQWMPDDVRRFWGSDARLGTQVGIRTGREIVTTGQAGYLIFGPYISLPAGRYSVVITGSLDKLGATDVRMDVAVNKGSLILAETALIANYKSDCLVTLPLSLDEPCTDFEVRVWVGEDTDLKLSAIQIEPWHPDDNRDDILSEGTVKGDNLLKQVVSLGETGCLRNIP